MRLNLTQLQLMCQHIRRTHEHTSNVCRCDFREPQLESFWPDLNSICDGCQKNDYSCNWKIDILKIDVISVKSNTSGVTLTFVFLILR